MATRRSKRGQPESAVGAGGGGETNSNEETTPQPQAKKPAKLKLHSDADESTWVLGKRAFVETFTAKAVEDGCRVEIVDRADGDDIPAELQGLVWTIALVQGDDDSRVEHDRLALWWLGLHGNHQRTHLCDHSRLKVIVWHLRLQSDHPGWQQFNKTFWGSKRHFILFADHDKTGDDAQWFITGFSQRSSSSSGMDRVEWDASMAAGGGIGSVLSRIVGTSCAPTKAPHYEISMDFVIPKLLKADLEALAVHANNGPLRCKINRYGCSLCSVDGAV